MAGSSPTRRVAVALVALTVLVAAAAVLALTTREGRASSASERHVPQFVITCAWSHRAHDDPIVHPGRAGAAHEHDFFGSTATGASSTATDLQGTPTTCQVQADTAAYWAPTLYAEGEPVVPGRLFAYYRRPAHAAPDALRAFPFGLAMVAGDQRATAAQPVEVVAWHCGASKALAAQPPTCPEFAPLTLRIAFPTCWDGRRLDSDDHTSHTSYPVDGVCPASHPVVLPELVLDVSYSYVGPPRALSLASGPVHTAHADFLNAWDPAPLEELVDSCLRRGERCGPGPNRLTD